jgi:hypothetical protein
LLYDDRLKQSILLPEGVIVHVARGEIAGTYLLWSEDDVRLWDRYGRTPVKKIDDIEYQ